MEERKTAVMKVDGLTHASGAVRKVKRLGRGPGSGTGKTAGRGHKGQRSRSGKKIHPSFEGGQMRLVRRLPKRGFTNLFRKTYQIVNLRDLEGWDEETVVNAESLAERRLVRKSTDPVKILGEGEIDRPVKVSVHKVSEAARQKIEAAGGSVEVISG